MERSTDSSEPPQPTALLVQVNISVKDAFIEQFGHQRPIKRIIVVFTDRDLEENRIGILFLEEDAAMFARLPYADFPGFWAAALRLDRVARLAIIVDTGTFDVSTLRF
jgi:hypothetical protein